MNDITRKIVLSLLALGATVFIIFILSNNRDLDVKGDFKQTYRSVRTSAVLLKNNTAEVQFTGKLEAKSKIDIYSEVGGVLMSGNFREGNFFNKEDVIVQINSIEFEAALKAQKTELIAQLSSIMGDLKIDYSEAYLQWESFLNQIDVNQSLPELPSLKNQKLKRFIAAKGILNSYYALKGKEEKLSKYSIKAPFNGVITTAAIKKGTLIIPGQKIGTYINPITYELEAEVSLSDLQFISKGSVFNLESSEINKSWKGKVSRINNSINTLSQMVKIYISVSGPFLKEGMFLKGIGQGKIFKNSLSINRKLIKNGGVYLVDSGRVRFKPVSVLYANKSKAIITGLSSDDNYITDNMKDLYDGMQINLTK
jgi:RND family efflux transporter MFP subunit